MFREWDHDTLALILESQNYRLESAIEFILESESGGPGGGATDNSSSGRPAVRYVNLSVSAHCQPFR